MKVALLLSGQPRFLRSASYQSIKEKILDRYDCDVYCHFWWNPEGGEYITAPWSTLGNMKIPDRADADITELYHPKKMRWDPPLSESDPLVSKKYARSNHPLSSYNLPSMYLSMKTSYLLMVEYLRGLDTDVHRQYDYVIRLRYDALLTNFPDLNELKRTAETQTQLYAPDYSQFHNFIANNGLIMTMGAASMVMTIYDKIDELYEAGTKLNDEEMVTSLVKKYNIPAKILPRETFYIDLVRCV